MNLLQHKQTSSCQLAMSGTMRLSLFILLFSVVKGTPHVPFVYSLPAGLESVDGSDPFGGCPQAPQNCTAETSGFCDCPLGAPGTGVLIDGVVPVFDPVSDTDWSNGLFTVNRSGQNQIVLAFGFETNFNLRGVELKLFNCPSWNIAAPAINVYGSLLFITVFDPSLADLIGSVADTLDNQDCSSLVTVSIPVQLPSSLRAIYYIEFTFPSGSSIEWVRIGEIQFSDETPTQPPTNETTTTAITTTPSSESPTTTGDATTTIVLAILVAVFGLVSLTLTVALAVVSVRYYRRFAQSTATEGEYEDVRETDNRAIELRTNEAYGNTRPPGSEEGAEYEVISN